MREKLNEKMLNEIGLILEYYANSCYTEEVEKIVNQIQNIFDYKEPTIQELKPLLQKLYSKVVKREFHSDLLENVLKKMDEKD